MLCLQTDTIGDMAIVECKGTIMCSEAAWKLRQAVVAHRDVRIVVLDLSQVVDLGTSGVTVLRLLQKWAHDRDVELKLFNPSLFVRHRLKHCCTISEFDIAPLGEIMALLSHAHNRNATPDDREATVFRAA